MNIKKNTIRFYAIALIALSLTACSKGDQENPDDFFNTAGIQMKIEDIPWKSTMTTLFTEQKEDSEIGKYYYVSLMGMKIISEQENDVESMGFYITIPESRFRNPKGIYQVIPIEVSPNQALAVFSIASGTNFISGNPGSPSVSVGTIEITGFEVGMQTLLGMQTGIEGYTKLAGKFNFKLSNFDANKSLTVTEGQFNIK